jgi:hypothetical protein
MMNLLLVIQSSFHFTKIEFLLVWFSGRMNLYPM